ncbi:copper resistance protein B [Enhydrobacter aerosaccus]|uniref:Copper resistance protein B n=1 Tax=Enhydrobacter aerosaccus TaxID=225324 RepID=A0A1T4SJ46_9HYPH|nr:copper resistance protein B [Enhydrobacter aerosaccus]KAF0102066.1 MAG: copper resistance protein CopB [Rhodospirillaceae bacterium]SKA28203.1 copper resistance protein B [Enhydrobacter aerosaccus]
MKKLVAALCAALMVAIFAGGAHAQQTPAADQGQPHSMPKMLDQAIFAHLLFDQLEGRFGFAEGNTFRWSAQGWLGTDENRVWLLSEGRFTNNELDDGIQQLLYGRAITTYFDALVGIRYDLDSAPSRGWGAIGIQGLAPQFFKVSAIGYVSGEGHLAARLEASYDLLITQRLILQPQLEMNFYTKDDPARLVGAGLSELDAGLRLRYEITREFAPYVGITYLGQYGATADYVSAAGGSTQQIRFTVGLRAWF